MARSDDDRSEEVVRKELLDSLLADYRKPEDLIGEKGLLKQLTKLLVEKALEAEMADHRGRGKNEPVENLAGNTRNGKSKKTLKGDFGELPIEIPRDRHSTFEPQLIPKHQTRWTGFDDKILSPRIVARFRTTMRYSNSSTWRSEISARNGPRRSATGRPP